MNIAVITDLHANREAVEAVLEHAQAQGAEQHAFVGDFVGYGADPAWVLDTVRTMVQQGALAVQGNHDLAVAQGASPYMRADARYVVDWTRSQLDATQISFLAGLPLVQSQGEALFVHANAFDPPGWGYIHNCVEAGRSLAASPQRITFCGHMHEPRLYHMAATGKTTDFVPVAGAVIRLLGSRRWLAIPGSSGQPRDGDPAACYAMYDDQRAELTYWRVPYDVESAQAKIRAAQLPQSLAHRLGDGH